MMAARARLLSSVGITTIPWIPLDDEPLESFSIAPEPDSIEFMASRSAVAGITAQVLNTLKTSSGVTRLILLVFMQWTDRESVHKLPQWRPSPQRRYMLTGFWLW